MGDLYWILLFGVCASSRGCSSLSPPLYCTPLSLLPSPQIQLQGLEERCKLSRGVRSGAPAANAFNMHLETRKRVKRLLANGFHFPLINCEHWITWRLSLSMAFLVAERCRRSSQQVDSEDLSIILECPREMARLQRSVDGTLLPPRSWSCHLHQRRPGQRLQPWSERWPSDNSTWHRKAWWTGVTSTSEFRRCMMIDSTHGRDRLRSWIPCCGCCPVNGFYMCYGKLPELRSVSTGECFFWNSVNIMIKTSRLTF